MKSIIILLFLILLVGCSTVPKECIQLKDVIVPYKECESGYLNGLTAITGHPAECLKVEELKLLRKDCKNF